uniref:ribonucleoside-diphosphate reductase n=1 Tax=viral metagenome TaxID=1070528 RepID=A0A6H1ZYX4_9ZZZZ
MEKISTVPEDGKVNDLDFKPSKTFKVITGCGNIYVTADFTEKGLHKIRMQRTSKLHCSPTMLNKLYRSATFQSRRDIQQTIKDLKDVEVDACDKFGIGVKSAMKQGKLAAYSCGDAIARCLEIILKENGSAVPK